MKINYSGCMHSAIDILILSQCPVHPAGAIFGAPVLCGLHWSFVFFSATEIYNGIKTLCSGS
jgi:hypothetical protein